MYVAVAGVVPHALGLELQSIQMCRAFVVCVCVRASVPSTADVSANEAYPEARGGITVYTRREGRCGRIGKGDWSGAGSVGGGRVRCAQIL